MSVPFLPFLAEESRAGLWQVAAGRGIKSPLRAARSSASLPLSCPQIPSKRISRCSPLLPVHPCFPVFPPFPFFQLSVPLSLSPPRNFAALSVRGALIGTGRLLSCFLRGSERQRLWKQFKSADKFLPNPA